MYELSSSKKVLFLKQRNTKQASKNNDGRASKVILCPVADFYYHAIKTKKNKLFKALSPESRIQNVGS